MTNQSVYIGTGDKCGFYTLHLVTYNRDRGYHDCYIQNLSIDWDTAFNKAQEYATVRGAFLEQAPFELDEFGKLRGDALFAMILKTVDPTVIPVGKFEGLCLDSIVEENLSYFFWMVREFDFKKTEQIPFRVYLATKLADFEDPNETRKKQWAEERAAQDAIVEAGDPVPVTDKRIKIAGKILSIKSVESYYGTTVKMLVLDDNGFKIWGSVPSINQEDEEGYSLHAQIGNHIKFMAKVERSGDDEKFGFFKRPTKAKLLITEGEV